MQPSQPYPCSSAFEMEKGCFKPSPQGQRFECSIFRTIASTASLLHGKGRGQSALSCALPRETDGRSERRNSSLAGDRNQNQVESSPLRGVALLKAHRKMPRQTGGYMQIKAGGQPCPRADAWVSSVQWVLLFSPRSSFACIQDLA